MITEFAFDGPPIPIGYPWTIRIAFDLDDAGVLFPVGAEFVAQVRRQSGDSVVLATASTANGGIARISDTECTIALTALQTAGFQPGYAALDLVRSDVLPHAYVGILIRIPVIQPITRI